MIVAAQAQRPMRQYGTQAMVHKKEDTGEVIEDAVAIMEQSIASFNNFDFDPANIFTEINLSLIVHVVYNEKKPALSISQVYQQIDILNNDFNNAQKVNEETAALATQTANKIKINFCLAQLDGKPAIDFRLSENLEWKMETEAFKFSTSGGLNARLANKYLNIWIVDLAEEMSGFAQMPGGMDNTDGIVIDPDFFGTKETKDTPYSEGKTLTHLVGSYLGLYELWNDAIPCADDFVDDTPIHNGPNYLIPKTGSQHLSFCEGNSVEMTTNFMDNTDDLGLNVFTLGQKLRMLAILSPKGLRGSLVSIDNICATVEDEQSNALKKVNPDVDLTISKPMMQSMSNELRVYPNPATSEGIIELSGNGEKGTLSIYNALGTKVFTEAVPSEGFDRMVKVRVDAWPSGTYSVFWQTQIDRFRAKLVVAH